MLNVSLKPLRSKSCPACNSTALEELVEGQIICRNCGLVVSSDVEGKGNNHVKNVGRLPHEIRDDSAAIILECEDEFSEWQRLLGVSDSTERNVALALHYMTKIVRKLQLPWLILEESINIYKALIGKCCFKGKRLKAISAAIVYASCKSAGIPCSLREVAKVSEEDSKKVFRSLTFIIKNLKFPQTQPDIGKLLDHLCKIMKVDKSSRDIAKNIMDALKRIEITQGKNPHSYAAAAIYIASILTGNKRTQKDLAEATRITEATIRMRYKKIVQNLIFIVSI
jgi:transcription initiation factor TFIIB